MTSERNRRKTDMTAFEKFALKAEVVKLDQALKSSEHHNQILEHDNASLRESNISLINLNEHYFTDGVKIGILVASVIFIALFIIYLAWNGSLWS